VDWLKGKYVLSSLSCPRLPAERHCPSKTLPNLNDPSLDPVPPDEMKVASIDGVREQDFIAGFPANFVLVESLCPGDASLRRAGTAPRFDDVAGVTGGSRSVEGESTVDREGKKKSVAALNDVFTQTSVVVVAHYSGLTVAQMQNLRKQMGAAGAKVQVAKNRLVKIAIEGTDTSSIAGLMKGPTLIAYSNDPVAAPKVAVAFAKDHDKLVILGGAMGKTALDVNAVKSLATLPSLDELRAKLVGLIQAPATKIAQLTTAPAAKLARVFMAYADKDKDAA